MQNNAHTPPPDPPKLRGTASNGVPYSIFDTWCAPPLTPEEKADRDAKILEIYTRSEQKKQLKRLDSSSNDPKCGAV